MIAARPSSRVYLTNRRQLGKKIIRSQDGAGDAREIADRSTDDYRSLTCFGPESRVQWPTAGWKMTK